MQEAKMMEQRYGAVAFGLSHYASFEMLYRHEFIMFGMANSEWYSIVACQ